MIDRIALYATLVGVLLLLFFGSLDIDVDDSNNDRDRGTTPIISTL